MNVEIVKKELDKEFYEDVRIFFIERIRAGKHEEVLETIMDLGQQGSLSSIELWKERFVEQ